MRAITYLCLLVLFAAAGCNTARESHAADKDAMKEHWNSARAGVLYNLARQQYDSGNFDDCRKSLTDAGALAPNNPAILVLSAKVAIEQSRLESAERDLQAARAIDPKLAEADYLSGVIYQRWQRPQTALEYFEKACEKAPADLACLLARAEMLVALDRPDEAMALIRDKASYFDNSAPLRDAIGQMHVRKGEYAEAVTVLRQAQLMAPDEAGIREHLALALYFAREYSDAADLLVALLKEKNYASRADLLTALGECQLILNRPGDARDAFESAANLQPQAPLSWLNLAKAAHALKDVERAEMSLKKAISIDPKSAESHLLLGYLRIEADKPGEALEAFRKASSLEPNDPVAICMIGIAFEKQGKANEAAVQYNAALKLDPNDRMARALLARIELK